MSKPKSLADIQAAFSKPQNDNEGGSNRPNNYYPFWNMKVGEQAIVRFLPDKAEDNPMGFVVEKLMHTLEINGEKKSVPCLKMYGDDCPICKTSSAFYKEKDNINGKKYWRKKQHIAQAIIVEDPLPADDDTGENHEGKIRFLALGYQLFNVIKETFEGGELDELPYAYENGCDFIIKKTKQGEYENYSIGSKFSRKTRDLDEDEIAIVTEELTDLSSLLPAKPELEKVESMLEAALSGGEYLENSQEDQEDHDDSTSSTPRAETKVKKEVKSKTSDSEDDAFDDEADEILASIRNRKAAQN